MLTALTTDHQLVNLLDKPDLPKGDHLCPGCYQPVRLKRGSIVQAHFAHVSLSDCQAFSENESALHLALKLALYEWVKSERPIQVEARISAINQIADLLVADKLALEVQCSPLSQQRLRERSRAYHQAGVRVLWLLGPKLWLGKQLTSLQKDFLYFSANMGFHLWELDLEKKELRLRYLIHEDLHGRVQCLTRRFSFGRGSLLGILRLPYQAQKMPRLAGRLDHHIADYVAKKLRYQDKKWMERQAEAYASGDNLLTWQVEDFYPQLHPPVSSMGFAQIRSGLSAYYTHFQSFYEKTTDKSKQILYPPAFYQAWAGARNRIQNRL